MSTLPQALYVANCQLDSRPDRSTERLAQARGILGSLASHQASQRLPPEACSVAVAGCFSEGPDGAVAHLLRYGWAPAGGAVDDALAAGRGEEEATQPYLLQVRWGAEGGGVVGGWCVCVAASSRQLCGHLG